jgi:hypothetical protein
MADTAWHKLWSAIEAQIGVEATAELRAQHCAWLRCDHIATERIKRQQRLARHQQELTYTTLNDDRRRWLEKQTALDQAWLARHEEGEV